ncbi:MAG: hypothetical protein ACOX3G_08190 [Armatimonadota bacterium]
MALAPALRFTICYYGCGGYWDNQASAPGISESYGTTGMVWNFIDTGWELVALWLCQGLGLLIPAQVW